MTLTGPAPAWATKDDKVGANQPDPAKFGAFVRTVAAHFKGRVDRYCDLERAEPRAPGWRRAKTAPKQYRSLYKTAYTAIKTVDPNAKVLFGELAPEPRRPHDRPAEVPARGRSAKNARLKADGLAPAPLPVHESRRPSPAAAPRTRRSASCRG